MQLESLRRRMKMEWGELFFDSERGEAQHSDYTMRFIVGRAGEMERKVTHNDSQTIATTTVGGS